MWLLVAALLSSVLAVAACGVPLAAPHPTTQQGHSTAGVVYVAIGASDAFGIGTDDPATQSWPTVLAGKLGLSVHLVNLGIPGEQVSDALANELPIAIDEQPAFITVWLGVNDFVAGVSLSDYSRQLEELLTTLRQRTHARIAVGNLPDLTLLPVFRGQNPIALRAHVQQWNQAIADVCQRAGVTLVDLYSGWSELAQHPEYVGLDGFHPSALGAARLADLFALALKQ